MKRNRDMKIYQFLIYSVVLFVSCSTQDEPDPEIFSQVAEISNDHNIISQKITYDSYGRVIEYTALYPTESVSAAYTYTADNLINIHTQDVIFGQNGDSDIMRVYEDELYLENGRASYCEGVFTSNDTGSLFQKRYRHDFTYTPDHHLNVIKCTEWNKRDDDWAYDKPWSWENYYVWENGNLIEVEDFFGNTKPYYTYKYTYSTISAVQNIVPIQFGRFQYYPLQLKGIFGLQPKNLIMGMEQITNGGAPYKTDYKYIIEGGKIINYSVIKNGISDAFSVVWTN